MSLSCIRGAKSPAEYAAKLFSDWYRQGVRTLRDAEEYLFLYDASNGKTPEVMPMPEAVAELRRFREERRARKAAQ